jgi:thymidylate synthase
MNGEIKHMLNVSDIRNQLIQKYRDQDFVTDKTGVKTIELIGQSFIADEDWIIRKPNYEYIERELEWYESQSLYVEDIPGETPAIWKQVASKHGRINSNYGHLIWSEKNGFQYMNVLTELLNNPNSRRAVMIYNRPSMHTDYYEDDMSDFICTYANTFMIRDGKLISHYLMRSNDAVFGYDNDVHWAMHVQKKLAADLRVGVGDLIWTATNLHVYERHFSHIEKLIENEK